MFKFWRNPEFVRHVRSELRLTRAITVAVVVILVCVLIGLACWSERQAMMDMADRNAQRLGGEWIKIAEHSRQDNARLTWLLFCQWLFGLQAGLIPLWSMFMCAQSVAGERNQKTWDFQRTTSLTAAELAMGKVLGEPILAYYGMLCVLPISLIAGLSASFSVWNLLNAYTGLIASALFMGLCGIWLSILIEHRSRSIGLLGTAGVYALVLSTYGFTGSWFPGLAAVSPFTGMYRILDLQFEYKGYVAPMLFGHAVPWLTMSLLLYISCGTWLALMVVRNLKRDYAEIRLLSRWQAVGCAAYLNFVCYALFSTRGAIVQSDQLVTFMVMINGFILFLIGIASLTPPERLKVWWRSRHENGRSMFSEDGLPWPWLGVSAIVGYGLMLWGLLAWRNALEFHMSSLRTGALQFVVVLVFVTRDVLFIQWCMLTRLRQPVLKGFLFLCLYYASAGVIVAISSISGPSASMIALNLLTPTGILQESYGWGHYAVSLYGGLTVQIGLVAVILVAIGQRLGRPSLVPAVSEG